MGRLEQSACLLLAWIGRVDFPWVKWRPEKVEARAALLPGAAHQGRGAEKPEDVRWTTRSRAAEVQRA